MKVAFVVNDLQLSGGVGVVLHHARELMTRHGFEVDLVLAREQDGPHWGYEHLDGLTVRSLAEAREQSYDVALSTWWETAFTLFQLKAERHASFLQSLEDRFYDADQPERLGAGLVLDLPVSFVTEARWIVDTLADLRPDAPVHYVRNGIDKDIFAPIDAVQRDDTGPLRILIEGNPDVWFKGVGEAVTAAVRVSEPRTVTVVAANHAHPALAGADHIVGPLTQREMADLYGRSDVLLKLSRVEGMYGPPLEGFHRGATCVTTPVTGHDEYIEHGVNALLCDWDDLRGTTRQLELLARDRDLLHRLRTGALETAKAWPDWEQTGAEMAAALHRIAESPAPPAAGAAAAMMADVRAGLEQYALHLQERREYAREAAKVARVKQVPVVSRAIAVRQGRTGRLIERVARRLLRR